MIVFHGKVFDGGLSGASAAYSLPQFDGLLAQGTRWYVTARCTRVTGSIPAITVSMQQSASGMPGEFKNIVSSGKVPIDAVSISPNAITIVEGSVRPTDANMKVPAGRVRLEINLVGADNNAMVEVWVTARNDP